MAERMNIGGQAPANLFTIRTERQTNCNGTFVRSLLVLYLTCCGCSAQSIAVGVIGGGRLTDDVSLFPSPVLGVTSAIANAGFRLDSKFYDVGPMVEIGINHGLAVEFNALYHRQSFYYEMGHVTEHYYARERHNTWDFPILLKYKLRFSALNPFLEAGVAPRTISGSVARASQLSLYTPSPPPPFGPSVPLSYSPSVGFVAGGGFQFNLRSLRLAPQIRYTRWATAPFDGFYDISGSSYSSNQNQIDLLVGISWKIK